MTTWVGIEVTRQVRVADGVIQSVGKLSAGGVNLLEHQIGIAKQITSPDQICILTAQGDEAVLELIAGHGLRELAPFDFIAMLSDRAKHGEDGAAVLLRQIAPLRDAKDVKKALKLLKKHPVVISASKPPKGHKRHEPLPGEDEPDYRCLAFEARRISEFSMQAMTGLSAGNEEQLFIDWDRFTEYSRPESEAHAAEVIRKWKG